MATSRPAASRTSDDGNRPATGKQRAQESGWRALGHGTAQRPSDRRCQTRCWGPWRACCPSSQEAICLKCASLAHLEYLPAGDAAVTRRATKYSSLRVVVMKKSAARKCSERQGIPTEPEANRRLGELGLPGTAVHPAILSPCCGGV